MTQVGFTGYVDISNSKTFNLKNLTTCSSKSQTKKVVTGEVPKVLRGGETVFSKGQVRLCHPVSKHITYTYVYVSQFQIVSQINLENQSKS